MFKTIQHKKGDKMINQRRKEQTAPSSSGDILKKHRKDFASIKATVNHLVWHYRQLLTVDLVRFYGDFLECEPLVIMAMLMNRESRNLLFEHPIISPKLSQLSESNFLSRLSVKTFNGETENYWKDIEPAGTEWMILRIENGNFVRNLGKQTEELSAEKVNGKFPILNGIDYKSNNANHKLVYLPCSEEHPFWKESRK